MKLRDLFTRPQANRNDRGFNMLELIMVVVVIAILGGIGFAIYRGTADTARGTVLDSNIATAAEELNAVLEINPLAVSGTTAAARNENLSAAMTNRTNFVWDPTWNFNDDDGPDVIRFQLLTKGGPTDPSGTTPRRWTGLLARAAQPSASTPATAKGNGGALSSSGMSAKTH